MKAKKNNGKPKFGIIVAATETPMGAAYKKALSSKQNKIAKAAAPEDKITGADFKALKGKKKKSKAPSMKKMQKEEDDEQTGY